MFRCSDPRVLIAVSLAFTKKTHVAVGDGWAAGALLPPPDTSSSGHCQWMATFGPFLATMHRVDRLHPSPSGMEWWTGWLKLCDLQNVYYIHCRILFIINIRKNLWEIFLLQGHYITVSHNSTFCRFSATIKPEKSWRPTWESLLFFKMIWDALDFLFERRFCCQMSQRYGSLLCLESCWINFEDAASADAWDETNETTLSSQRKTP